MGKISGSLVLLLLSAATAVAGNMSTPFQWRPFLAPFHSVVLHFPIGFLTMAGILEVCRTIRPNPELRRMTILVVWLSLFSGIVSAALGIMRAGGGGYEAKAVELHRAYGLAVPVFTVLTLVLQRRAYRQEKQRAWTLAYRAGLTCTLGLLVIAGHLGGNLTHGSKYLTANAPEFVRELLDPKPAESADARDQVLDQRERYYAQRIQPLLETKCYKCHGPDKQKGGYRIDQPELALKGGESGKPAIKPGDPIGSYLVQLILLPPEHDDVMPPEGREPLTLEEITVVLDWIRHGAVFSAANPKTTPFAADQSTTSLHQ